MKNSLAGVLAAVVIGAWSPVAIAGNYFSGTLGAVLVEDSDLKSDDQDGELSYDPGFALLGAVGTSWKNSGDRGNSGNGGRLEAEFGYRKNDTDELDIDGVGSGDADGDISAMSLMANLYYDVAMDEDDGYAPYFGIGAGAAIVELDADDGGDDDDTVFAGQLILGVSFITQATAGTDQATYVDVQYRYFATDDPEIDDVDVEYATHNLMVTLRRTF